MLNDWSTFSLTEPTISYCKPPVQGLPAGEKNTALYKNRCLVADSLNSGLMATPNLIKVNLIMSFRFSQVGESLTCDQSGEVNVALKTPSLHGKYTECGAKDWQH